ncbi:type III-B CRISPR module RAMP protein Cmr4 [Nostoc sp. LEGE 06077]|uniref:RAMP superfamily CRISPR-associated protein n=1 Tax=Nostoc sp. LEGE 06077 TaxID=915325 RepID=UPI00187E9C15|nr:RAMP superfamily CRISPR-associated protein [Nostoc sp. LEGE 06077]MBE9209695.1 type III-B CRISPR module RAMP protein Cmr4 [Nostoc sp. LEGE 06077]
MYLKGYGIIKTLAPLHVGASADEESGNLNFIFRDQFTQTGIVPGSSIRGSFRVNMRQYFGEAEANYWYGESLTSEKSNINKESIIKFEYASIVWLPVFCPGQPIVWVSCPYLLRRYKRITGRKFDIPYPYTGSTTLRARESKGRKTLFFNLGFLTINQIENISDCFPSGEELPAVVVDDADISMIHDMALYRQSRIRLKEDEKVVVGGGFFNTEALPEGTLLIFPIAIKTTEDNRYKGFPFGEYRKNELEMYLGGLESIGFGHCLITLEWS